METPLKALDIKSLWESFEYSIDPIVVTDANWDEGIKLIYVNNSFCLQTGYLKEELIGKSPKIFQGKESNKNILNELKEDLQADKDFIGQSVNYRKDGSSYFVKWSISPLKDKDGITIAYISFQKMVEKKIKFENEKLLSSIVENSENLILVTDLNGIIVYTNDTFNKTLGYKEKELIGKHSKVLNSGKQDKSFYKNMWRSLLKYGHFKGVFESIKKDGTFFYDKKTIKTIKDNEGTSIYYVSVSRDISKQRKEEEELKKELYLDRLTQLFNRRKYDEIIDQKVENYELTNSQFCLVLIDIDYFKAINDNYGHDMGDFVLKEFAKILQENIRKSDLLFRWGGEEFALVVDNDIMKTYNLSEKLRNIIAKHSFQSIKVTASFGVSSIKKGFNKKTLFKNSDKALYKAKQAGRNKVIIDE